jgi:aspartate/methionine/tyrosine aminotransferase
MKAVREFTPFYVMDLVRLAQRYEDTVHFEVGQPDLLPPRGVKAALLEAVERDRFAYTESRGLLQLREKIAAHYRHDYGIEVDPERILITPGTSNAFLVAYLLTLGEGGILGLADPSYPCYPNFAAMVDVQPRFFPVGRENGYLLKAEDLQGARLDALHISSPSNPTGTLYDAETLKELAAYCDGEEIALISDELYHGLVYENRAHSALEFSPEAIVINGFSKYFCMPGLRIGWMIVPERLIRPAEIIAQNLFISAPTLSQYAALEAFDYDYLAKVRQTFKERRDWLYEALNPLLPVDARPDGAFYLWCDVSAYTDDSNLFSRELLESIHIAVTPGIDFGHNATRTKLRFAYTRSIEHMAEGVERLKTFLKRF